MTDRERQLVEALRFGRQELHACQATIHLCGVHDPAYVSGAKEALKAMDAALAAAEQPKDVKA
jgi:hypothetical protein